MGSRKKHRNRENEFYGNDGGGANNSLGLDFNALSSLFGNIDQNQLMSMIQMLGQNGINMDNVGGFEQSGMNGGSNSGNSFNNMGNNIGNNNIGNLFNNMNNNIGNNSGKDINRDSYEIQNKNNIKEEKSGELDATTLINKLMGNNSDLSFTEDQNIYEEINKRESTKREEQSIKNDPNIEMLLAMRKIVSKERVRFIDKIIQLYINGEFGEF